MKIKTAVAALALLLLISCGEEGTQIVKKGNYMLEVPSSFKETNGLNDVASLQYQNALKEFFVIVIDEPKIKLDEALESNSLYDSYTSDLDGYCNIVIDKMKTTLGVTTLPKPQNTKIHGLDAKLISFEGIAGGYKIYWKLAFIEGNKTYYQVMTWTAAASKEKHEAEMQEMIDSFKETDKSKN